MTATAMAPAPAPAHRADAPARLHPLRILPAPRHRPPVLADPEWDPALVQAHCDYVQDALAVDFDTLSDEELFGVQSTQRADLPEPRQWAGHIAQALVEVMAGSRPAQQVLRWTTPEVYAVVARRAVLSARRAASSATADRVPRRTVVRVTVCQRPLRRTWLRYMPVMLGIPEPFFATLIQTPGAVSSCSANQPAKSSAVANISSGSSILIPHTLPAPTDSRWLPAEYRSRSVPGRIRTVCHFGRFDNVERDPLLPTVPAPTFQTPSSVTLGEGSDQYGNN